MNTPTLPPPHSSALEVAPALPTVRLAKIQSMVSLELSNLVTAAQTTAAEVTRQKAEKAAAEARARTEFEQRRSAQTYGMD